MNQHRPKYVKCVCETCGVEYAALKDQVDAGTVRHCGKGQASDKTRRPVDRPKQEKDGA